MLFEVTITTILGLIILNRLTSFTTKQTIMLTLGWIMCYFLTRHFYRDYIKSTKKTKSPKR